MLSTTSTRNSYTGTSAVSSYDYDYKIYDQDDLLVTVTDTDGGEQALTVETDYTVNGIESDDGGAITLVNSGQSWLTAGGNLLSSYGLVIRRVMDITQTSDIRNQGDYYPRLHEDAYDKLVMMIQQVNDLALRSVKSMENEFTDDLILPSVADRASKFLYFNASGVPTASADLIDSTDVPVSAFGETLVAASTAAAARTVLGFTGAGSTVATAQIEALAVTTAKIDALAVTTAKIAANAVTTAKLDVGLFLGLTTVTAVANDFIGISDTSDSGNNKKVLVSDVLNLAPKFPSRTMTSSGAALTTDHTIYFTTASQTLTLFACSGNKGRRLTLVHNATSLTHTITVDGSGAETVGGVAALTMNTNGEILVIQVNDAETGWTVIDHRGFDIELYLDGLDGHGSTDTKIMSFDTAQKNTIGVYATYSDTAENGMTVTMLVGGLYALELSSSQNASSETYSITVNEGATLTTNNSTPLTYAQGRRIGFSSTTAIENAGAGTLRLNAGDVIRCHDDGASDEGTVRTYFKMTRIA